MVPAPRSPWSERLYRLLWLLYPEAFRDTYGQDALELFRDRYREAAERWGSPGVTWLWMRTVPNVVTHGLMERISQLSRGFRRLDRGLPLRLALRSLVRAPAFSATVVVTLGVGLASAVTLFSVLEGVLLEPLPFPDPDRLVRLWEQNTEVDAELQGVSPLNFVDWQRNAAGFEGMAAWYLTSGTYRTEQMTEEVRSAQVTPDFFRVLGVPPALGRDFRREEVVGYGPLMLSHGLWKRLFGGDPDVVGTSVRVSSEVYEVIGVMPPDFTFPDESVESWLAWDLTTVYAGRPQVRTWRFLNGIARLPSDMSYDEADEELTRVAARLAESHPEANRGWGASMAPLHEEMVGDSRTTLWVALAAALSILLIACSNVANMLLSRAPTRGRELALRQSLGATQRRLVGELLTEGLVLSGLAAILGLVLGRGLLELLIVVEAGRIPRIGGVRMDGEVLAFATLLTIASTVAFGLAPAIEALRSSGPAALGSGTRATDDRGRRRLRESFVGAQIAVALVLLTGAGILTSSLRRLTAVDPGFDPSGVMTFRVSLDGGGRTEDETALYYEGLIRRLTDLPFVDRAGASQALPMSPVGNDFRRPFRPAGSATSSADAPTTQMRIITAGYLDAVGMRVVEGAAFPRGITADEPPQALVNQTLARRLWPDGGAVGGSFDLDFRGGWRTHRVVGVLEDVRHYGLRRDPQPEVYLAHPQAPYLAMSFAVRVGARSETMVADLRDAVLSETPRQPPHAFAPLEELVDDSVNEERFLSILLGLLAGIGVLLSATGVYSVVAYSVSRRRQEIGVRMALGAPPRRVAFEVLRSALTFTAVGVLVGVVCVLVLGGLVDHLVYQGQARDPTTVAIVCLTVLGVAGLAAVLPAFRASRVAPSESIQAQ
ncbi:MAG: ABC transporter permease [Longimicrobiales bacterium]|nr:ABC transporter permease [Longimicrobiales bacterium]